MRSTYLSESDDDVDQKDRGLPSSSYKLLIMGDQKVGKTSFITRLTKGYFSMFYMATKNIEIYREVQVGNMKVVCWDIPQRINYHFKLDSLKADAVILMFDTSKPNTKQSVIERWKVMQKQLSKLPYVFVVGVRLPAEKEPSIYYIDNMSTEGYNNLLFNIHKTIHT